MTRPTPTALIAAAAARQQRPATYDAADAWGAMGSAAPPETMRRDAVNPDQPIAQEQRA